MSDFPRLLKEAGVLLYGQDWKTALANELGVDRSTIIRWANGAFRPENPYQIKAHLLDLLTLRRYELDALSKSVRYLK